MSGQFTRAQWHYLAIDAMTGAVINAAFSCAVTWLVFGGRPEVPVTGLDGALFDFAPHTFMVALMTTIVPGFLGRRRVAAGGIAPLATPLMPLPPNLLVRAITLAILATLVLGGGAAAALYATAGTTIAFGPFLIGKCLYGALVALVITPFAFTSMLADKPVARARPGP